MNLIVCGACGQMGRTVSSLAEEKGISVVCGIDSHPSDMPFPVMTSFREVSAQADVVIDFSSAEGLAERLAFCEDRKIGIVLGATGWSEEDFFRMKESATRIPLFQSGNLSVGINLLQILTKRAAEILKDFDAEIIERHHHRKKDAPSGTALMLAQSVREGFGQELPLRCGREGMVGARPQSEIGIHAVRGGTIVGEHEVMFAGEDEIITLTHSARSRRVFAVGALRAAAWLIGKPAGYYSRSDLLSRNS